MKISKELRQQLIQYLEEQIQFDDEQAKELSEALQYKKRGRKVGWRKPVG